MLPPAPLIEIHNGRVLLPDGHFHRHTSLFIQHGRILHSQDVFYQLRKRPDLRINAHDMLIIPGLIDAQINGAFGVDFTSDDVDALKQNGIRTVRRGVVRDGVTSLCPTVISSSPDTYAKVLHVLGPAPGSKHDGAEILGIHLEGPFISNTKYGAHNPTLLQSTCASIASLERVYTPEALAPGGPTRMITLAPELPGATDHTIAELVSRGLVVSIGHSDAGVDLAEAALEQGATAITHLFNAMRQFHHRDPGLVGTLGRIRSVEEEVPYYGLICDGIHVHPNSVRMAYHAHPNGAYLVTDAISAMGLPPGVYQLSGQRVEKTHDRVYLADVRKDDGGKVLAGSCVTMMECVRNMVRFTGCRLEDAVECASGRVARMLGVYGKKGVLKPGADADIVFLEEVVGEDGGVDWVVRRVLIAGEEVDLDQE